MARRKKLDPRVLAAAGLGLGLVGRELLARRRAADLQGQVALITGGSRGLGLLLAREFARHGCRIAICARDEAELDRARASLAQAGADVLAVGCDVSNEDDVARLIARATAHFGQIDILVNNAGRIDVGPITTMTAADFARSLDVMFWGLVYPTLAVLPAMRARGAGRIVNVTSVGGKAPVPTLAPYCSAKFAAVGFSETLRAEAGRFGITVTTIAPGLMRTGSYLNAHFKEPAGTAALFALLSSVPGLTISAEQAAREIVTATRRGEAERVLGLPAWLLARFHGLFPGATAAITSLVSRGLQHGAEAPRPAVRGMDIAAWHESPLLRTLTGLGTTAAQRTNQYPGPIAVPGETTAAVRSA